MHNTKLIVEARSWARGQLPEGPWGEKHVIHRLADALEAAEAELTQRSNVGLKLAENDLYPDAETCAWCDSASAGLAFWQGDDRQHPSCGHEGHGLRFAAAPVSLEAVKAEAWDEGNEACRAVYVEGRKSGPVVNPYRKLEEANRG